MVTAMMTPPILENWPFNISAAIAIIATIPAINSANLNCVIFAAAERNI